jgi:hypothetical protein
MIKNIMYKKKEIEIGEFIKEKTALSSSTASFKDKCHPNRHSFQFNTSKSKEI